MAEKKAIYGIVKAKEVNMSSKAPQPPMGGMVPIAGIKNVIDFDYDTTSNRIYFVQRSEESSASNRDSESMVYVAAYTNVRLIAMKRKNAFRVQLTVDGSNIKPLMGDQRPGDAIALAVDESTGNVYIVS